MSKTPGVHLSAIAPLLLLALLTACGGGAADAGGPATAMTASDATPGGRAQALAFTMPAPVPAPTSLTGNVSCSDWSVGEVTVDNLDVPPATTCQLNGTTVRGSIHVHPGAILLAHQVQVAGSVQGTDAAHVQFSGSASRITGGLQLQGGGSATVSGLSLGGDLVLNGLGNLISARDNRIGGNLQLTQNTGGAELRGNLVRGNVQCTGNLPAPLAADNSGASLEGQCQPTATGSSSAPGTPPLSGNITCVGLTLGAISLDSVSVPAGASCTLAGTRLNGNLEVGAGARVVADNVSIRGGVVADGATELGLGGSSQVTGSVQVQRGVSATVAGARIGGSLQIDAMTGPVLAADNRMAGNLQAHANRGGVQLVGNTVTGAMQCKDNLPAPTGRSNLAAQQQDQCLGL